MLFYSSTLPNGFYLKHEPNRSNFLYDDSLFTLFCCLQKYKPFVYKFCKIVFAYVYLGKQVKIQKNRQSKSRQTAESIY